MDIKDTHIIRKLLHGLGKNQHRMLLEIEQQKDIGMNEYLEKSNLGPEYVPLYS